MTAIVRLAAPIIVNVAWYQSGAHQVVCAGKPAKLFVFLDPYYGLVEQDPAMYPRYSPRSGPLSTPLGNGEFTGWYTKVL